MKKCLQFAALALCFLVGVVRAADISELAAELARTVKNGNDLTVAWWFPAEYWDETLKDSPDLSDEGRAKLVAEMRNYTMVAIVRGHFYRSIFQPLPRTEIANNLTVHFNGDVLGPLEDEDLTSEVRYVADVLKPVVARILGQFGKGVEIFLYSNSNDGKRLIDPRAKGLLQAQIFDDEVEWRTPLAALFPPKRDPKTGESFPGTYNYNPYTGDKLPPTNAK